MPRARQCSATSLPRSRLERERLRTKGQFWTPDWVADFMVAYVLQDKPSVLLDPAVGEGAFFRAAKRYAQRTGLTLSLCGRDVDAAVLNQAEAAGLAHVDLANVRIQDFVLDPPSEKFPAIVANPPYIRHHRLSGEVKRALRNFAQATAGLRIDGRAGFHVYFLIRALEVLAPGGRLAFIVSADTCEGVFADALWRWICSRYRLDGVVTFASEAAPFPDVDTNALVFLIRNVTPSPHFDWVRCRARESAPLLAWLTHGAGGPSPSLEVCRRSLAEGLSTGLSRSPCAREENTRALGDFASVMRGIVTGDNAFFFMTAAQAAARGIPPTFLVRAVGRTRDVQSDVLTPQDLERLEACGRPTWLLDFRGASLQEAPAALRQYLQEGERAGLPNKVLIRARRLWYRMETRDVPPIVFAYLGRRNARFIRNLAGVVPLTCLHCIYPKSSSQGFVDRLWAVLKHPETVRNLYKVGKSYGRDAIKVEPRALERLPLPDSIVRAVGLDSFASPRQQEFNFE